MVALPKAKVLNPLLWKRNDVRRTAGILQFPGFFALQKAFAIAPAVAMVIYHQLRVFPYSIYS
jgi:hypothetical protein